MLAPVLEKLTKEPNTSGSGYALDLVKIDVDSDDGQILSQKYKVFCCTHDFWQVQALPTIIAFRDGTEISRFVGARDEHGSQQFLSSL
ncbi:hypothetical protein CPC08DRAFT_626711 [Agrocybe pediades]|nr:hypothetical protein CPC08DRAFT_626711 [Agrocybe pediades]